MAIQLQQTTDTNNITSVFGGTAGSGQLGQQKGQSFTSIGTQLVSVQLVLYSTGAPADNFKVDITSSLGGSSLASGSISASSISFENHTIPLTSIGILTNGGTYYIQASRSGAYDTTNYISVIFAFNTNPYSGGQMYKKDNGTWSVDSATSDWNFVLTYLDHRGSFLLNLI